MGLTSPLGTPLDPVERLLEESFARYGYRVSFVHLSWLLDDLPFQPWGTLPGRTERSYYEARMDAGDTLRESVRNGSALAALAVARINAARSPEPDKPDPVVLVLRSLKHPAEEALLRHVYGSAFSLLGVSSTIDERRDYLVEALSAFGDARAEAERLIERDEADQSRAEFGQNVRATYTRADAFVATVRGVDARPQIDRFVDSLFGAPFLTPKFEEEAMRLAYDASLRSAALGRQVGAALVPKLGTPIVVGTNEVPKPGGGQYWTDDVPDFRDFQTGADPNPTYTRRVVQDVLERLARNQWLVEEIRDLDGSELLARATVTQEGEVPVLEGARAAALIEFTRCLHAEQAAIINAARAGVQTDGAVLFTTTFPCHECAKMIVGAGIVEVQFIEPYPKSLVGRLYRDLVDIAPPAATEGPGLVAGRVPFRPFQGIAPRRYDVAFTAGKRQEGADAVRFDYLAAAPRSSGWGGDVAARESSAISSIQQILAALAEAQAGGVTVTGLRPVEALDQGPATVSAPPEKPTVEQTAEGSPAEEPTADGSSA